VLRLPEPISKWWAEDEAKFRVNEVDARTLSLYPLVPETEQRLFLRGDSGQLYVAKISTALSHVPIVNVIDVSKPAQTAAPTAPASLSPTTLLIKLMKNEPAQGFAVATSSTRLVTAEQWVMDALEVWSAPGLTGIVAKISRTTQAGTSVAINPDAIEITSPQLGQFRMMNAERWALDDALPQTNAYLVFTKR
jgi:hypothetical protein